MDHRIFRIPVLGFFFRTARAIPIAPAQEDPAMLERAFERSRASSRDGELVGIFPEGRLTTDGEIGEFRGGIARILERTPVPVIPMALSGLWDSLFARNRARLRHIAKIFPTIRLAVGQPVPAASATPAQLQAAVTTLRGDWR